MVALKPRELTRPAALSRSELVADSMAAANMALSRVFGKPLVASCACFNCLPNNSFSIFEELKPFAVKRLPRAAVNCPESSDAVGEDDVELELGECCCCW